MNRLAKILLVAVAGVVAASADTISQACTSVLVSGGIGSGTHNCAAFDSGPGGVITQVRVYVTPDYTNGGSVGTNSFTFTYTAPNPFTGGPFTVTGGVSSGNASEQSLGLANISTQIFAAFNIGVTSSKNSGSAVGTSSVARVEYDYTPGTPSVPEPSTYAMMGLGLVGLAALRRRVR